MEKIAILQPVNDDGGGRCCECTFVYQDSKTNSYQCRANPPMPFPVPTPPGLDGKQGMQIISLFPPVSEDSYCGMFEPDVPIVTEH
jgi:hypothetical protein